MIVISVKLKVAPPESSATKPMLVTELSVTNRRVDPQVLLSIRAPVALEPEPVPS